mmetsp:Transcript_6475/g.16114  ORF Transcript_6475/g.16114 Transcript_6475/m.16114 type:complete len:820 (-) Transcript_6475:357-2816(-)
MGPCLSTAGGGGDADGSNGKGANNERLSGSGSSSPTASSSARARSATRPGGEGVSPRGASAPTSSAQRTRPPKSALGSSALDSPQRSAFSMGNIVEVTAKHTQLDRHSNSSNSSSRSPGPFPSSPTARPSQPSGGGSQASLGQVLHDVEASSSSTPTHAYRSSESNGSTASKTSESASTSTRQHFDVTKHTDSVTKSSVKMGETEYSQFNQYIIIKDLGRGVHAKVMLGLNTADNLLYAIKVTNNNAAVAETAVRKEIAVLKKLNHDNVLKLFEVIDDHTTNELFLVLEYARAGPIFTRYNRLPIKEGVLHSYMVDIIQGLDYLHHAVGIAHMDLKPENLLKAADGTVKIADFGVSFIIDRHAKSSALKQGIVGTPAFVAPEMLGEDGYDPYIADIWSLGVCMFNMATARLPFVGKTIFQLIALATRYGVRFPPLPDLSDDLKHLITIILEVDPTKRATISEIMSHRWITSYGENPLPASLADQPVQIHVTEEEVAAAVRADPLAALLTPVFKTMHFVPGDFIISKGALGDTMYFINSGECEVLMDALDSDERFDAGSRTKDYDSCDNSAVLAIRTAGEFVGEMAVLEAIQKGTAEAVGTRTASVRARKHVDCLSVTAHELLAAIQNNERGRDQLLRTASYRLSQNEEIMLQLAELRLNPTDSNLQEFAPSRTLRVLYAEDSVPTQFIVKRLMKRIGNVELACVNDGKAALEYCEKCARGEMVCPDIILMDCQMPVMDGLKATTSIRALPHTTVSSIPIVAVSSGVKSMSQKDCIDAGMDDYAAKPLNQKILIDVLVRNLNADLSQPVDAVDVVPVLWT